MSAPFQEFYRNRIQGKSAIYELKLRMVGQEAQIYIDIPEFVIEDVQSPEKTRYQFPATQLWMPLTLENGKVCNARMKATLPPDYPHPFSDPTDNTIDIDFDNRFHFEKRFQDEEHAQDTAEIVRWVLENSADALIRGYDPCCVPWRPFNDPVHQGSYEKLRIEKDTAGRTPDNIRSGNEWENEIVGSLKNGYSLTEAIKKAGYPCTKTDKIQTRLYIRGLPEDEFLAGSLDKEYTKKTVEEAALAVLEIEAKEPRTEYQAVALKLLEMKEQEPEEWKDATIYKIRDPYTGRVIKVERTAPVCKFIKPERVGETEERRVEIYLNYYIRCGCW